MRRYLAVLAVAVVVSAYQDEQAAIDANRVQLNDESSDVPLVAPGVLAEEPASSDSAVYPAIFNLATNALVSVNATCGANGPESYCKLVEHVFLRSPQCDECDMSEFYKQHPISYAIDGTNRWYQSPSLAEGLRYEWVTITLDLRQVFQIAYIIIKAGNAPRPGNWILERSLDNTTWNPWQYFAVNDEECMMVYGVEAQRGRPRYDTDEEVICTSYYSKLDPLEDGEIHTSLLNYRPSAMSPEGPSAELQDFTKARYIRLRMQKIRTLNSDWMMIFRSPDAAIDPSYTQRYFYSIKDISIGGQCICYGHAARCPIDPRTRQLHCECRHNTCGENCDRCCPLYNQEPWQPGTVASPNACTACQCFQHADECRFDPEVKKNKQSVTPDGVYEGGGVCSECRDNTEGTNCQNCMDGFYRPIGVSHYARDACRPCDCDMSGSLDETCTKDEASATNGAKAGDCKCKPGYGGRRCDRCAPGYKNYPECEPCSCHKAGSANYENCDDICVCKANVEGETCDKCKDGHFGLDERNLHGCTKCFCFGVTEECREIGYQMALVEDHTNWTLSDVYATQSGKASKTTDTSITTDQSDLMYWVAPRTYTGNLLLSYGGILKYFVYFVTDGTSKPTGPADVRIEGPGDQVLEWWRRGKTFYARENNSVEVSLRESGEWYNGRTRQPATKVELMSVLSDVHRLMLRSVYDDNQLQATIAGVSMEKGVEGAGTDVESASVEACSCPDNYAGSSCESCVDGYRRVNNQFYMGQCVKCECNGHSMQCDAFTGDCVDCAAHTAGRNCEQCEVGYFGDALSGDSEPCKQCACPLLEEKNNFSPTCRAPTEDEDSHVCLQCAEGHEGAHCEECAENYFGSPEEPGSSCQPCECNGNVDPSVLLGNCDRTSGECLKCIGNTDGFNCENCREGYYGSALAHDCRPCNCNAFGRESVQCNNDTGLCECKEHYVGRHCDQCEEGFGGVEEGCTECNCDPLGATSERCDSISGQCQCKPGTFGRYCDVCDEEYFNFTVHGCLFCGCYRVGSEGNNCDQDSGQCKCKANVVGRMCHECEEGFYNITSNEGCQACKCHPDGSVDSNCDDETGICRCKQGVTGDKCDRCNYGYYGLGEDGCTQCQNCPAPGHVCHNVTGECVCPPNTIGEMCEHCAENTWKYDILDGCKPCDCSSEGADGQSCDSKTGQCVCRSSFTGLHCDSCMHGYYNFPDCTACECDEGGSLPNTCREGQCSCDEEGKCKCKTNVEGDKCNKCALDSFSIDASHPDGCTQCFCFNRTDDGMCVQTSRQWQQIGTPNRVAAFEANTNNWYNVHGVYTFPQDGEYTQVIPPHSDFLYWSLPMAFLGDKVASYNGMLRFTSMAIDRRKQWAEPDWDKFHQHAEIILVGNHRIRLEYRAPQWSRDGKYEARLREDMWRNSRSPQIAVSREQFMVALQNIQAILVRGTFSFHLSEARLQDVSMDIAVSDAAVNPDVGPQTAIGVEECQCPEGYGGLSCQEAADGFCRKRIPDYLNSHNDMDLVGVSERCACNGHSSQCNKETCFCENCQHHTTGAKCELCSSGYYGNATMGSSKDCTKCACPLVDHTFSATCRLRPGSTVDYVCDACEHGYSGDHCETCIDGYYGTPEKGETCQACACDDYGALSQICDKQTGQCNCRADMFGLACDRCQGRFMLYGRQCRDCETGCTKDLIDEVDQIAALLDGYNHTGLLPAPWKALEDIEAQRDAIKDQFEAALEAQDKVKNIKKLKKGPDNLKKQVDALGTIGDLQQKTANNSLQSSNEMREKARDKEQEMDKLMHEARELMSKLHEYQREAARPQSQAEQDNQLREAKRNLERIKEIDNYLRNRHSNAENELKMANATLNRLYGLKYDQEQFSRLNASVRRAEMTVDKLGSLLYEDALKMQSDADAQAEIAEKMQEELDQLVANLLEMEAQIEDLQNQTMELKDTCSRGALTVFDAYTKSNKSIPELKACAGNASGKANNYQQLLPEYTRDYVDKARRHVHDLEQQARVAKHSFSATKDPSDQAVEAANAYKSIVDDVEAAKTNVKEMQDTLKNLEEQSVDEIVKEAEKMNNKTEELREEAEELMGDAKKLDSDMEATNATLRRVKEELKEKNRTLDEHMSKEFKHIDAVNLNVKAMGKKAKQAKETVQAAKDKLEQSIVKVDKVEAQIKDMQSTGARQIGDVTMRVTDSKGILENMKGDLEQAKESSKSAGERTKELMAQLAQLREKVRDAREVAEKVKLAVGATPPKSCVRSFDVELGTSQTTNIYVKYRPAEGVPDAVLVSLHGSARPDSEYILIELENKKFRARWNIGDGEEELTNDMMVMQSEKDNWYVLHLMRAGQNFSLEVGEYFMGTQDGTPDRISPPEGQEAKVAHMHSELESLAFNIKNDPHALVSLGLLPQFAGELQRTSAEFYGTVSGLKIGNDMLPSEVHLWQYESSLEGCMGSEAASSTKYPVMNAQGTANPHVIKTPSHMIQDGFVQLESAPHPYDARQLKFKIVFRTFVENGLLYFRGSEEKRDFISLDLYQGLLRLQIYLGGESLIRIVCKDIYVNDGNAQFVEVERKDKWAKVTVGMTHSFENTTTGGLTGLDAKESDHYIGGVPEGLAREKWGGYLIQWNGFYGCVMDFSLSHSPTNLMQTSLVVKSQNWERGCMENSEGRLVVLDRKVGLNGKGYMMLAGQTLTGSGSVSFNFRTFRPDAVMLHQSSVPIPSQRRRRARDSDDTGYFVLALQEGHVAVRVGSSTVGTANLRSVATYADGKTHNIVLRRSTAENGQHELELIIDDDAQASAKLKADAPVGSAAHQLFLGGYNNERAKEVAGAEVITRTPFEGCLSGLSVNYQSVLLTPLLLSDATVGQCPDMRRPQADDGVSDAKMAKMLSEFRKKRSLEL